jgi:hypothetical protein
MSVNINLLAARSKMIAIAGARVQKISKNNARRKPGIKKSNDALGCRYFAAASLSGSFTAGKVSNSIAHGSPFTF